MKAAIAGLCLAGMMALLGACGSSSAPSSDYFKIEAVKSMDCKTANKADLQEALDRTNNSDSKQAKAILKLNPGETSLEPVKVALANKLNECGSSATVPNREIVGSGKPAPHDCPENMKQNFDPNRDGNFASNGVGNTNDILALSGRDARALAFYAHRSNLVTSDDPNPLLVPDNSCLSQEGQNAWNMLKGALTASGTKVNLDAQAPENYYNTGMVNGRPVVDTQPGIGGDRSAIEYTFPDGTKLIVLKRCSNLALPSQGNLPKAVTNHQRPPGTTVTPPPSTTPPYGCPPDMPYGSPPNCKDAPNRAPDQQGNAPVGAGRNTGTGETNVYTPPPTTTYKAPPSPTRTTQAPPPVITVTQTPTGSPTTATPTQQPPNSGSVVPTSNCGRFC